MIRFLFCQVIFLMLAATAAHSTDAIGFREFELDPKGNRPLHIAVWYPVKDGGKAVLMAENDVFFGVRAVRDGAPDDKARPLVVLSHGNGGSWRNLMWLAKELVGQGYIVAAPNHPGTTVSNKDPMQASRLWERPRDLTRVIDALMTEPASVGTVDPGRIAAIGHSLGGWTVTALAGARFDPARFEKDCLNNARLHACKLKKTLGLGSSELARNMSDRRVGAFVSLDLGLARGFTPESLANIAIPALIIGAGVDIGDMPAGKESGYLVAHLPKDHTRYVGIPDALHFSFLRRCKPGAVNLLDKEAPGDGIICKDGQNRTRQDIHRQVTDLVIGFLARAIPAR